MRLSEKIDTKLKLSTVQVKGEVTGFRYNVGERMIINNNFFVEMDKIHDFVDELNSVMKLVDVINGKGE